MSSTSPLVSIITPCYNYGRFLAEALDSLLSQTYSNWECIIVNDGSKDNTEEIALSYVKLDSRFKYIYQKNSGLPNARNAALEKAQGKYFQLLDADDLLEKDKLLLQVALLEQNRNVDLVYSNTMLFESDAAQRVYTSFTLPNKASPTGKNEVIISALLEDNFFLPGCVMFRKEVYEQVGKFNEELYGLEDWNYWFRAALIGIEFYSDKRIGTRLLCRNHEANMSKAHEKMLNARIQARQDAMRITEELINKNTLKVSFSFIKNIQRKQKLLMLDDQYQYHFRYGKKYLGLQAILKYSLYSRKPFFIVEKAFSSIKKL